MMAIVRPELSHKRVLIFRLFMFTIRSP